MGHIPEETIEQIAAANDIVEVIGSYFPVKRAGAVWKALCPFHNEKTPSFHVNPARQSYHCFGCGAGGSVFRFVMAYENLDFVGSVKRLADRAGITLVEQQLSPEDDARLRLRKRLLALHKEAADWFHQNLLRTNAAAPAREYLKKRALNSEIAVRWKIGYAPDSWDALSRFLHSRDFRPEEITRSGLVSLRQDSEDYYDRFRHRLMFPIHNDIGEVIAFSGRALDPTENAKYVNSPETMLFTKGNVLFGLHATKRELIQAKTAILLEGQIDLIRVYESGIRHVVAPQGTAFTERQAAMLKRFVETVILCFDSDAAGEKAAERSLASLLDQGLNVRVATMPPGEDPDSLIQKNGPEAFQEIIDTAEDFFDFHIRRLPGDADVRQRQQFARKMADFISLVRDPVLREDAISKTVSRIGLLRSDFEKLIPRSQSPNFNRYSSTDDESEDAISFEPPGHAMRLLCHFALRSPALRCAILDSPWEKILSGQVGVEFLGKILPSQVDVEKPASISSFFVSLDPSEEAFASKLLTERLPEPVDESAARFWKDFCLSQIDRQLKRVQHALLSAIAAGEEIAPFQKQQKEILDLKNDLTDVPRPSDPSDDPF